MAALTSSSLPSFLLLLPVSASTATSPSSALRTLDFRPITRDDADEEEEGEEEEEEDDVLSDSAALVFDDGARDNPLLPLPLALFDAASVAFLGATDDFFPFAATSLAGVDIITEARILPCEPWLCAGEEEEGELFEED